MFFLLESENLLVEKNLVLKGVSLEFEFIQLIKGKYYALFKVPLNYTLLEYNNQRNPPGSIFLFLISVIKNLERLKESGYYETDLSINNVLFNELTDESLFLDIGEPSYDTINEKQFEEKTVDGILDLYYYLNSASVVVASETASAKDKLDTARGIAKFEQGLEYIKTQKKSIKKLLLLFQEFHYFVENNKKFIMSDQDADFQLNDRNVDSLFNMRSDMDKNEYQSILLLSLLSFLIISILVITVCLMSSKVPVHKESDFERRVIKGRISALRTSKI